MTKRVTMNIGRKCRVSNLKRIQFVLDRELIQQIRARAKNYKMSAWVRAALWEAVNK